MAESLRCTSPESLITGWDFSTGAVKCLAFDMQGRTVAEVRMPTDLWHGEPGSGVSELNLMQLEGQARASVRAMAARLRELGRLQDWVAGGISATHHTAGRIDADRLQVRRAICWNDQTLAAYRRQGEARLGGPQRVLELIGGPWADRYSLSHIVKDEDPAYLSADQWKRTARILSHGSLSAGYLTGHFDVTSVSAAASTGIMDLRTCQWRREMLDSLASPEYRELAWRQLPRIIDQNEPIGELAAHVALEAGLTGNIPVIFPTLDDQAAGLVGGGAVDDGQMAIILGNSAVVNSSSNHLLDTGALDVMKLNWGPNLWMRCYNNGAQFLNELFGANANWDTLEQAARQVPAGCDGALVAPFVNTEPSLGISKPWLAWNRPVEDAGTKFRVALECLAYMLEVGVRAHEAAGQKIRRITVSGGIARSTLMCEILASVLNRPLTRLESAEGTALGVAVTALAAWETQLRRQQQINAPYTVADAVQSLVRFRDEVAPRPDWAATYATGRTQFAEWLTRRP